MAWKGKDSINSYFSMLQVFGYMLLRWKLCQYRAFGNLEGGHRLGGGKIWTTSL